MVVYGTAANFWQEWKELHTYFVAAQMPTLVCTVFGVIVADIHDSGSFRMCNARWLLVKKSGKKTRTCLLGKCQQIDQLSANYRGDFRESSCFRKLFISNFTFWTATPVFSGFFAFIAFCSLVNYRSLCCSICTDKHEALTAVTTLCVCCGYCNIGRWAGMLQKAIEMS